jgi:hypothetical protein
VPATVSAVYAVLNNVSAYPRWWPSLAVCYKQLNCGNGDGLGSSGEITTKGFLPYILKWKYEVTEAKPPHEFSIKASGDLTGHGRWILKPNGNETDVTYEWNVTGDKALLKYGSIIFRPLFASNHNFVMRKGLEGLQKELLRQKNIIA